MITAIIKFSTLLTSFIVTYSLGICTAQQIPTQTLKIVQYSSTVCQIYSGQQKISQFRLSPEKKDWMTGFYSYSIEAWLSDSTLVANELYSSMNNQFSNEVLLDLTGKVVQRFTENKKNDFATSFSIDKSFNRAVYTKFTMHGRENYASENDFLRSRLMPQKSIILRNLKSGQDVELKNLARGEVSIDLAPWSPTGDQLVYTIFCAPLIMLPGQVINAKDTCTNGSYIYDFKYMQNIKFLPGSIYAIWSPVNDTVAYLTEKGIWLYDCKKNVSKLFLGNEKGLTIEHMRWLPNGQYLYVQRRKKRALEQSVYNVSDGTIAQYANFNFNNRYFFWRDDNK